MQPFSGLRIRIAIKNPFVLSFANVAKNGIFCDLILKKELNAQIYIASFIAHDSHIIWGYVD